ncbi:MAG: DUF5717 family protein [Clostridiales bacterium]|nr:DUF5717 family protein [Clostridiales bacterium]
MRRKIQEIIRGEFEYDRPSLLLSEKELLFSVVEHETYSGSFHLESSTQEPVRGIVTCEHPNIQIRVSEFDAVRAEIDFTFSGDLVTEGEEESGVFVVTSSSGEYLFPFTARITRHYVATSIGRIKTLNDFTNLCNLNWEEALEVFRSPFFCNIFHKDADFYTLLYRSLTQQKCTSHEMEEFLIAAGRKKRSVFTVSQPKRTYFVRERPVHVSVEVRKSEWGYCDIRVSSEAPFVSLGKKRLQMYDFSGKHAEFDVQIFPERMREGKNQAVLCLQNGFQTERMVLTCVRGNPQSEQLTFDFIHPDEEKVHSAAWEKSRCFFQLEKSFLAYGLEKKSETEWILESIEILQQAAKKDLQSRWLHLFLAYLYWKADETVRMEEVLETTPRSTKNARTPLGAFYLYLTVLKDADADRTAALTRIREIYAKFKRHPALNWILLQMDDSLTRNPQRRYEMIRDYMSPTDSANPIFYLEAARLLQKYPELLNSREEFDQRLIGWMARKNLLTEDLAWRIQEMAQGKREFSGSFYRVLCKCHKLVGDDSFVKAICTYLIKTNRYGAAYFPWFGRGVEQHLKIAGLYEAYMLSWSRSMGELPPEIVRYFSMNSTLPARKKAMLFAYIVRNRHRLKQDWPSYMVIVRNFAVSELEKGHMNEDLAIIYEELRRTMKRSDWVRVRGDAEDCYRIYTEKADFPIVRICQDPADLNVRRVPLSEEGTYVIIRKNPYIVLFEDPAGLLYSAKDRYRVSRMLPGLSADRTENGTASGSDRSPAAPETKRTKERLDRMEGSIDEMTELLLDMRGRNLPVISYAQQIMIRMLFTGYFAEKHGEVFQILAKDPDSEELVLAYVTILCRNLMFHDYPLPESIYRYLGERILKNRKMNVFERAAFLRLHLTYGDGQYEDAAEKILREYLFRGICFPFFAELSSAKKREYFLTGVRVLSFQDRPGEAFFVEFSDGTRESMTEALPGLYTWPLRILPGETRTCTVADVYGRTMMSETIQEGEADASVSDTRYGLLGQLNTGTADPDAQYAYAERDDMVNILFTPVRE